MQQQRAILDAAAHAARRADRLQSGIHVVERKPCQRTDQPG
jgi:hypothetical protein